MSSYNQSIIVAERKLPYRIFVSRVSKMEFSIHGCFEIIYVVSGTIRLYMNNEMHSLQKGEFIFIRSYEAHWVYEDKEPHTLLVLQIDEKYLKEAFGVDASLSFSNHLRNPQIDTRLINALRILYINFIEQKGGTFLKELEEVIQATLPYIKEDLSLSSMYPASSTDQIILKIARDLRTDFGNDSSLKQKADHYNISISHLCRMFKKITGITYSNYVRKIRVNQAVDRIINTNQSITNIALDCGFSGLKSMNEAFNVELGLSAQALRKRYKEIAGVGCLIESPIQPANHFFEEERVKELLKKIIIKPSVQNIEIKDIYKIDIADKKYIIAKDYCQAIDFHMIESKNEAGNFTTQGILDDILHTFSFKEIRLFFSYKKGEFFLKNAEMMYSIEISNIECLLNKFVKNNVRPILRLDIDLTYTEDFMEKIQECRKLTVEAIRYLSAAVGRPILTLWKFEFNLFEGEVQIIKKKTLENYIRCIVEIVDTLYTELGNGGCQWGLALGKVKVPEKAMGLQLLGKLKEISYLPSFYSVDIYYDAKSVEELGCPYRKNQARACLEKIKEIQGDRSEKLLLYVSIKYILKTYSSLSSLYRTSCYTNFILERILDTKNQPYKILSVEVSEKPSDYRQDKKNKDISMGCFYDSLGLPTPSYYLYNFLDQLNETIILEQPGCLVTQCHEDLQVLLYEENFSSLQEIQDMLVRYPELPLKKTSLQIRGLKGYYKITQRSLDYKSGSSSYQWKQMGELNYVNQEEKQYLVQKSIPLMKVSMEEVSLEYEYSVYQKSMGITLIKFQKI